MGHVRTETGNQGLAGDPPEQIVSIMFFVYFQATVALDDLNKYIKPYYSVQYSGGI